MPVKGTRGEIQDVHGGVRGSVISNAEHWLLPEINPDYLFVITEEGRHGACLAIMDIEYSYYWPDTPLNDEFELLHSPWEGITYFTMIVPLRHRPVIENVLAKHGLELADGIPHAIHDGAIKQFDMKDGPNVWSVRYRDENHPAYGKLSTDPQMKEYRKIEARQIIAMSDLQKAGKFPKRDVEVDLKVLQEGGAVR